MKFHIIVSLLLLLLLIMETTYGISIRNSAAINSSSSTLKTADKVTYSKKVSLLKKRPTKSPTLIRAPTTENSKVNKSADVTAAFKDFPEDDLEFIAELDKQFEVHGEKIKFKIEHDNATDTKNSKRTIDGELGYGNYPNGYEYNRPKFMFYPYSQDDNSPNAPGHHTPHEKTKVTIEPSYSYELRTQTYIEPSNQPHIDLPYPSAGVNQNPQAVQQQPHQEQYEEPVIVLRIPGPTKYATHLQSLLQQYLEIRAAQYLHILEETELQKQPRYYGQGHDLSQGHTQYHPHIDLQPPSDDHSENSAEAAPEDPGYQQEVDYADKIASTPSSVVYPTTDNVYQTYKENLNHNRIQQIQQLPLSQTPDFYRDAYPYHSLEIQKELPLFYYMQEPQYTHPQANLPTASLAPIDYNYHNVYYIAMASPVKYEKLPHHQSSQQHEYFEHKTIYVSDDQSSHSHEMPLSENNPLETHTKVIFKKKSEQRTDNIYPLPSIPPYERHTSTSLPTYNQHNHQQQLANGSEATNFNYENATPNSNIEAISITQRPFNYHAHSLKAKSHRIAHKRGAASNTNPTATSATSEQVDKRLQKIREYVRDKLGAKKGATFEFKTTEVVEG